MSAHRKLALVSSLAIAIFAPLVIGQEIATAADLVSVDKAPLDRTLNGGVVSYATSLKKVRPAVVSVYSKSYGSLSRDELIFEFFGIEPEQNRKQAYGLGSGVIVSENGYIITNSHVVSDADELTVRLDGNRIYAATLIGTDPQTDIAVIKIEATELPTATLADSDQIEVGDVVFAIGNPLGVGKTVTMGIVSATDRYEMSRRRGAYEDFIQTDAPINSGNSGGALVDAMGRLIGINTMIQTDGRSTGSIGIGFAIPVNLAYSVMADLIDSGTVSRGFLGVGIESLDEDKAKLYGVDNLQGALVNQVNSGSPAQKAGIAVDDIIVEVNGREIDSPNDLRLTISQIKPGTEVDIVIVRNGERSSVQTVLALLGENVPVLRSSSIPIGGFLEGVTIAAISPELRMEYGLDDSIEGVVITEVESGSRYSDNLPVGMVILKVNGEKTIDPSTAGAHFVSGSKNTLFVAYQGVYRWVSLEVD